jgi:hypothetical protein
MHARLPSARLWLAGAATLTLVPACGYIGFEKHEADAGSPGMPGPDAGVTMDSGTSIEDAAVDAMGPIQPMDSGPQLDATHDLPDADAPPDAFVEPDPPATQVDNYCQSVPKLQREPVIDGVVDSALKLVPLTPVGWSTSMPGTPVPAHTTASFALAWRADGLYTYVRVVDPNRVPPTSEFLWQGDGTELYFDSDGQFPAAPAYDSPGTVQIIVAAPADDTTPSTKATRFRDGATLGAWTSTRFAAFPTPDGYVLEGFLQADALDAESLLLETGHNVGVDLSVNVSALDGEAVGDGGLTLDGLRLGQYFLQVTEPTHCGGLPFCNSAAFCAPTLVE